MMVLVCGGREFDDWHLLNERLTSLYSSFDDEAIHMEIIEGGAKGADFLARVWAKYRNLPWHEEKADWTKYGKAAGGIRNQVMLDKYHPNVVIAFPGGTGTADMVRRAKAAGIEVIEVSLPA